MARDGARRGESSQVKSSQVESSQVESSRVESSRVESSRVKHSRPGLVSPQLALVLRPLGEGSGWLLPCLVLFCFGTAWSEASSVGSSQSTRLALVLRRLGERVRVGFGLFCFAMDEENQVRDGDERGDVASCDLTRHERRDACERARALGQWLSHFAFRISHFAFRISHLAFRISHSFIRAWPWTGKNRQNASCMDRARLCTVA